MSVDAVAIKLGSAGLKDMAHVAASCAESLNRGAEPAPDLASYAHTRPSSVDAKKVVGACGAHVSASTSAPTSHLSGSPSGTLTSACDAVQPMLAGFQQHDLLRKSAHETYTATNLAAH